MNITIEFRIFEFQLRFTILIFWAKFAQKGCFWSKTENSHLCVRPWSCLTILDLFAQGPTDNGICNKTRLRRVRRLLMKIYLYVYIYIYIYLSIYTYSVYITQFMLVYTERNRQIQIHRYRCKINTNIKSSNVQIFFNSRYKVNFTLDQNLRPVDVLMLSQPSWRAQHKDNLAQSISTG